MDRCPFCRTELEPYELEPADRETMRPDGAGVCGDCYVRWHDAPVYQARLAAAERERDEAITMLAAWVLAVEYDSSWDSWDGFYKDAAYNPGPLRDLIDARIDALRGGEAPRA